MTRDERLAALEKKAQRLRERAAAVAKSKRRILKAKSKAQRAAETRAKILAGAALITFLKKNPSRALSVFADRVHDYETIRESFPALPSFDTLKTTSSLPAGVTSIRLVDGELRSFDAQGRRIPTAE